MVSIYISIIFLIIILVAVSIDYFKKREKEKFIPISVIIPCYNDGDSIENTIDSLYKSYPNELLQVFVIDDKSTDDSLKILEWLTKKYNFTLLKNEKNLWKVATLNNTVELTKHGTILILDADMKIAKKNFVDMFKRKTGDVVAVSSPYVPYNKWFWPTMQSIEYVMLRFLQWSYNLTSAIWLWGGCILVDKKALLAVKKFSIQAIIEDMDLAFKLNKAGYKVQQSLIPIMSGVPDTFKSRWKQKLRWWMWWAQCFIKYWKIWIKNPFHLLFLFDLCLTIFFAVWWFVKDRLIINSTIEISQSWTHIFFILDPRWWFITIFTKIWFTLFALPYVIPLIKKWKDIWKIVLIIPFSLVYIPLFTIVNAVAIVKMWLNYRKIENSNKRWR